MKNILLRNDIQLSLTINLEDHEPEWTMTAPMRYESGDYLLEISVREEPEAEIYAFRLLRKDGDIIPLKQYIVACYRAVIRWGAAKLYPRQAAGYFRVARHREHVHGLHLH